MEEDVNISYAFRVDAQQPVAEQPQAAPDLYALQDCERIRLHTGGTLLISKTTGTTFPVTQAQSMALWNCRNFHTLDEHARRLEGSLPGEANGLLNALKDAGLLTSAQDAHAQLSHDSGEAAKPAPTRVFIITCDRPEAVERLLDSMMRNAQLSRHEELFLIDDSRQAENAELNRELASKFSLSSPRFMHYVGAEEQARLMAILAGELPEHQEAIEFLMDRQRWQTFKTYGLSRNLCLLMSVGYRCIVLDDDVLCQALQSPQAINSLDLSGGSTQTYFYSSIEEWQQDFVVAEDDPLIAHACWLGASFSTLLENLNVAGPALLENASAELVFSSSADSRVLVTECGTLGDPGTVGNRWMMNLPAAAVERVLASPGGLQAAFTNRQCWKGRNTLGLAKVASMSQVTGMDNSVLLPPYFPAFRGEDLLFGRLLNAIHPDSLALTYNWSIPHLPLEQRKDSGQGDATAAKGGIALLVDYLFRHVNMDTGTSPTAKLELIAAKLDELATLSNDCLRVLFKTELARVQTTLWAVVDSQIATTGELAPQWKDYLERTRQEIISSLQHSSSMQEMPEIPEKLDEETIIGAVRSGATGFAAVLRAWPDIREAASKAANTIIQDI
jgi:hypothetical protein